MSLQWPEPCNHKGRKVGRGLCRSCYGRAWKEFRKPEIDPRPILTCLRCDNVWRQKGSKRPRFCQGCSTPLWNIPKREGVCQWGKSYGILVEIIKQDTNECIEWPHGLTNGYAHITGKDGGSRRGNIVAWEIANGRKVPYGLHVRHTCDNPPCVNPKHLLVGTRRDNMQDAVERGRNVHGSRQPLAKLNEDKVRQIRKINGLKIRELAEMFGASQATVCMARNGKSWKHVRRLFLVPRFSLSCCGSRCHYNFNLRFLYKLPLISFKIE